MRPDGDMMCRSGVGRFEQARGVAAPEHTQRSYYGGLMCRCGVGDSEQAREVAAPKNNADWRTWGHAWVGGCAAADPGPGDEGPAPQEACRGSQGFSLPPPYSPCPTPWYTCHLFSHAPPASSEANLMSSPNLHSRRMQARPYSLISSTARKSEVLKVQVSLHHSLCFSNQESQWNPFVSRCGPLSFCYTSIHCLEISF